MEWYDIAPNGTVHGFQAKFVGNVDDLTPLAKESLRTVGANRSFRDVVGSRSSPPSKCRTPHRGRQQERREKSARQRWDDTVTSWKAALPGTGDIDVRFVGGGALLDRLTKPGNEGRPAMGTYSA
ncbi:hypothetical protein [Micromonospora sicca]|uniref:hypothetical protein n=1 Tax=Micromonospora sicca TaxID=2202420 RepID=UPI0011B5510A|nr:hypothetical protein [Micromonospora sp. 4G51]